VARCPETLALGVCVSTAAPAVGSRVPHVEARVGAIATQAKTNVLYGINGLRLLKMGFSPKTALETMLKEDPDRESRQVIIIDKEGRSVAFTGTETVDWKGHLIGKEAGGDKRGKTFAALLVAQKEHVETRPSLDLRVDEHRDPVRELRRVFEIHKELGET